MERMNPLLLTDGYKTGHHQQYPEGTNLVYSNLTPRSNKYAPNGCEKVLNIGHQMFWKWLVEVFDEEFFSKPKDAILLQIGRELSMYLNTDYDVSHFGQLHDIGYLPLEVKALPEGTEVPIKVPVSTIKATQGVGWITNFLETIMSTMIWQPMTSASIALQYRRVMKDWMEKTDKENAWILDWQCHDFSMRGMAGLMSAILSGVGHAMVFSGSDTLPVISAMRKYYKAEGFVVGSVNATEHSVMCAGTKDDEKGTFLRLLDTYPTGILSVVSDTWDLWKVCTEILPSIKDEILARDGKLVIRPDSGDPVDIICGTENYVKSKVPFEEAVKVTDDVNPENKGVIELLWDVFGGTVNEQGYKVLDPHIGAIYGDSITIDRAQQICERLEAKGFASTNIVLGIGSYTYQYNTRDTFGFAVKATYVEVDGVGREIFKDPATDDGTKKSAKGLMRVDLVDGEYVLKDQCTWEEEQGGELRTIYKDGHFYNQESMETIRERISKLV